MQPKIEAEVAAGKDRQSFTMIIFPLIFIACGLLVAAAFYVVGTEE